MLAWLIHCRDDLNLKVHLVMKTFQPGNSLDRWCPMWCSTCVSNVCTYTSLCNIGSSMSQGGQSCIIHLGHSCFIDAKEYQSSTGKIWQTSAWWNYIHYIHYIYIDWYIYIIHETVSSKGRVLELDIPWATLVDSPTSNDCSWLLSLSLPNLCYENIWYVCTHHSHLLVCAALKLRTLPVAVR
jgi:hypothetical protein